MFLSKIKAGGPPCLNPSDTHLVCQLREYDEEIYKQLSVMVLAEAVTSLVQVNDKLASSPNVGNFSHAFDARILPEISPAAYLERIVKYSPCSKECFLVAFVYLDRIIGESKVTVTSYNVHRLLIACVMMAAKLFDDSTYNNKYYAVVGGLPVHELNRIECELLCLLGFSANVEAAVFDRYRGELDKRVAHFLRAARDREDAAVPRSLSASDGAEAQAAAEDNSPAVVSHRQRLRRCRSYGPGLLMARVVLVCRSGSALFRYPRSSAKRSPDMSQGKA
eukprot:TRINITY_DN3728_c0_g1_i2.p1 TRINITY_DN3728_c0_g1~~TRINITY_DN3728_c0_g1_i2.p1  ORF type:complete len:278 (-),score=35.98 TRINITY_DN3728_c0_g1_i2:651-1484(-)